MKKFLSWLMGGVFVLSALLISFFPANKMAHKQTFASSSIEEKYYDSSTIELISKNPSTLMNASADKTPFDSETEQRMEGFSITPIADEYGQVSSVSFSLCDGNGYTPQVDDNILLWVYLIDAVSFKLEITLNNSSSQGLVWTFGAQKIFEMGSGWKLLVLKLSDYESELDQSTKTYSLITFKYFSELSEFEGEEGYESYQVKTDERFSFYHIFTTKNANSVKNSGILYSLSKTSYKFSDDFDIGSDVFIGDKLTINAPSKIFKYLYIGKNDLSDYLNSGKYYWSLSIKNPSSVTTSLDFGDSINFFEEGFYYLKIQLFEEMTLTDELILNAGINILCDELNLGKFVMGSTYKIQDDEKILIMLNLSNSITIIDDISVSLSNNNAEIESYYEEDGVLYICVVGKADGISELEISAKAKSKHNDKIQNISSVASIDVNYSKNDVDIFMVILWITFGGFCLGIIIYLSISVVKARKNDVK